MRKINTITSSAHDGYSRCTSLDCGKMGKGFRKLKPPEEERLWKGRVGGEPGRGLSLQGAETEMIRSLQVQSGLKDLAPTP